jgi:glycosyltransferase involved in cell wall biosynthesis
MRVDAPLISVVIATRERAGTLAHTLSTALNQKLSDYEIVVSDNCSEDATADVVNSLASERIRYVRTERRLSMCDNYEFALHHASGEYVIFIGDDDAVMPDALSVLARAIRDGEAGCIYMWPLHIYDWPVAGRPAGLAYLAPIVPRRTLDLRATALRVVQLGGWKYYELPSPYHAAIPRRFLSAIRERTGRVFHSTQPDVFTAMALPSVAHSVVNLGVSVTLNGRSATSNGLGFVAKSALQNIEKFIAEYGDYRFHQSLATAFPGQVNMIPDAVLIAKDLFPDVYQDTPFNFDAMWAYICRLGFLSPVTVLRARKSIRRSHPFHLLAFLKYVTLHQSAVVRRRLLNRVADVGSFRTEVPPTISEFVLALDSMRSAAMNPAETSRR